MSTYCYWVNHFICAIDYKDNVFRNPSKIPQNMRKCFFDLLYSCLKVVEIITWNLNYAIQSFYIFIVLLYSCLLAWMNCEIISCRVYDTKWMLTLHKNIMNDWLISQASPHLSFHWTKKKMRRLCLVSVLIKFVEIGLYFYVSMYIFIAFLFLFYNALSY